MKQIEKGGKCVCGCIFEYDDMDVLPIVISKDVLLKTVKCPACGAQVAVGEGLTNKKITGDEYFPKCLRNKKEKAPDCTCYHDENGTPVCWGTKECEPCTCGGYTTKCNFYPEKRKENKK
ncbi:MAG: hypothetical protein II399_06525 [Lachnospiraceae bacterium]|nr:hypothetical protein [Lachnospiraceae bacterium]